ncbi:DUF4190 domain-containing protein [Anaerolentibacter hominis]|uniref:DUF4190 domain-containing protein n=1 Tax=Anaerolentibacter hominis TaxID=3079009 RepID=UPI0031B80997
MNNQTDGKSIASLVLGIVSLVFIFLGSYSFIGIILAVIGLVLGVSAKKETGSGMATAGIVLSIIGLAMCALSFLACAACVGFFAAL